MQRQGLSTAQQAQILSSAGLLQTTQRLNASLVEEAILNSKISGEKAVQILTELGVIEAKTGNLVVTKECTVAEVAQALATKGIVGADAEAILSQLGLATANTTTTASFAGLTTAIKANIAAMGKWLVTNPVGWCVLAISGVYGLSKVYDALTVSEEEMAEAHEESVQKAKDSISEYEELKQELETIQQTYDDNERKLKDLYKLRENQTITQAEEDYLEELEGQNEKLRQQIEYKQTLADIEAKEAEDDAVKTLNEKTQYGNKTVGRKGGKVQREKITDAEKIAQNTSTIDGLTQQLRDYETVISGMKLPSDRVDVYTKSLDALNEKQRQGIELTKQELESKQLYEALLNGTLTYEQYTKAVSKNKDRVEGLIVENNALLLVVEPLNDAIVSTTGENYELKKANDEIILNAKDAAIGFNEYTNALNGTDYALDSVVESSNEITVSFSKAFNSLDFSEQKDELLELAKAGELTPETLKSVEGYNTLLSQTGLEVKEAVKEIYKLVDATARLSDMSSDLSSLGTAYKEFKEDGFASINAIESLREKFGELKDFDGNNLFEDFANIIGSDSTTVEEKQAAFNELATSYLLQEKALGKLTEANKDYYITQLKSMGIANAESIVTKQLEAEKQALLLKEEALALTSEGINSSSTEKIKALLKEAGATQLCREALFKLHVQEEIFNTSELDPRGKIEALIELATAYGVTSKNIENARKSIEGDKASGGHSGLHFTEADVKRIQEDLDANLLTDSEYVFSAKVDFNIDDKSNGNSKSDTYFDWIETKLDNLNDQLDETKEKAENSLNGWKIRGDAFTDAENQIKSLIATQEKAKARYLEEANKSGLPQPYIDLIKDGAIDIDKLSNDNPLKEQIESYQEWYDKVKECDEAIDELNADLKQLYRDKREFRWEIFDYLEDSISRITGEADYLVELLSNEDLFDDNGNLTKYADATLGLHVSNIETYKQLAQDNYEEMISLEKELANGGGQEVLDKYNERVDAHRDTINAIQKEKQAILDLVEEGYNAQLDALNKLINKKKEALSEEKALYDYQQSIAEKTKNISSLQKQYDTYKNSTSEEDIAKAQQLKVKLEEAKADLEQTEYEKMISDQEQMLDQLSSDYEQWIEQRLENSDTLLQQIIDNLSADGSINATLQEIAKKNGTFVSDELTSSISDGANSSINSYLGEIIKLLGGDDSFFGNAGGKGYASGTKRSGKEWAWTQEKGVELIRTKDGALLTPLDNSMVFDNESSKRLWEFSQNPSAFLEKMGMNNIIQPIFNIPKLPNIERVSNQTPVNNITHMEVVLPNVTNYDDFMNRMQNDKRFDNIVTASMNSKMTGSNSLSKFRF